MAAGPSQTQTAPSGGGNAAGSGGSGGAAAGAPAPVASVIPFVRGSGKGSYKLQIPGSSGLTLGTATKDLGPIDIKAYDYMRALNIECVTTAAGGILGTAAADAPFNLFTNVAVKQPNGQTMYQVSSGYHAAMIQKYGMNRAYNDPRADPTFVVSGSQATFAFRIPFELDMRDALGALPNKDAAAPFTLELTLNTMSNVFGASQGTSPTFTVNAWLEAYDQPPTQLNGQSVQTTPPNMNTLQRWTEQNITMNSGQFDARVRKLGNYVRAILPISKNSAGARIVTNGWADPVQIVLDEDVKDNISQVTWQRRIWEGYGYGGVQSGTTATLGTASGAPVLIDSPLGADTGVWPIPYFFDTRDITENVNWYLPTIESEDYLLRGSWGSAVSKLTTLICEVLPQGDIFS
jgi:hypothetical protein